MAGPVDLGVLDHDAVAEESIIVRTGGGEASLEHDGDALLEQLGRVAAVTDVDSGAVLLDGEDHVVARVLHRPPYHRALDAEALGAQRRVLVDRLVGRSEVQRRVAETAEHEEAERAEHDDGHGPEPSSRARPHGRRGRDRRAYRGAHPRGARRAARPGPGPAPDATRKRR